MIVKDSIVELIANTILETEYNQKNIEVSSKKPCKGIVRSVRYRKYGNKRVRMVTFSPDIYPELNYELSEKNFKEVKE